MNNFLFCFDSNYNIPASCSIISLLNNVDEKIKIDNMHQDESNSKFLPEQINNHKMIENLLDTINKVYKKTK